MLQGMEILEGSSLLESKWIDMKTADRTLEIFEAFAAARKPLSLSELARLIESPVSSCHGLLRALQKSGYVFALNRRYYPTRRLYEVGAAIASHDPVVERLSPVLERLRDETGETIILGQQQDQQIIYLQVLHSPQIVRYTAPVGAIKPLPSSAIGKAFLGEMSDADLLALLDTLDLKAVTSSTITDREQLLIDIQWSRKRGYFITRGENVPDVMAIARVFPMSNEMFALAVAGPMQRMEAKVSAISEALIEATASASDLQRAPGLAAV
jgi:DNA-binding IclR family transcriptional regulator